MIKITGDPVIRDFSQSDERDNCLVFTGTYAWGGMTGGYFTVRKNQLDGEITYEPSTLHEAVKKKIKKRLDKF